jgi:hypothetical protein
VTLDTVLQQLAAADYLSTGGTAKSPKVFVTETGRAAVSQTLGIGAPAKWPTWAALCNNYLVPHALGIHPATAEERKKAASAGGLAGIVLSQKENLPTTAKIPTKKQAVDALLWRQVGRETSEPFSLGAVKAWLLKQFIGDPDSPLTANRIEAMLPARAIGARRADINALRKTILADWCRPAAPEPTPAPERPATFADNPEGFVADVYHAARATTTGWMGETLLLIAPLYLTYREQTRREDLTLEAFKAELLNAHRARRLSLQRADYVDPHEQEARRTSEIIFLNDTFHLLRVPTETQPHDA